MKRIFMMFVGILVLSIGQMMLPNHLAHAGTFESGTYDVPFELKEAGNNNTSIADGYFSKPAKLVVKNGVNYIQLTTTQSDWIKSVSGPQGGATVISESGNTRTVQFEVGDLSNPVNMKMHVVVPEEIAGMKYDNNHSLRAVFNTDGIAVASSGSNEVSESAGTTEGQEKVGNPKTGDSSPIWLYVALLIGSIGIYTIYKRSLVKTN